MLAFIIIGAVGLALLILSMLLGELFDLGDGLVSGTSLGVGGVVFGALGAIATTNDLPPWTAYVGSAVVAVAVMLFVRRVIRGLASSEDGAARDLVGMQGAVTSTITGGHGEVSLDAELERRLAWADQVITEGTRIVVLDEAAGRVRVTPYWPTHGSTEPRRWPQAT